jgi:hypothetical protein
MNSSGAAAKWTARLILSLVLWVNATPLVLAAVGSRRCCCGSAAKCCCHKTANNRALSSPKCPDNCRCGAVPSESSLGATQPTASTQLRAFPIEAHAGEILAHKASGCRPGERAPPLPSRIS